MAEILSTTDCIARVERIIREAKTQLVLMSPYVDIPPRTYEELLAADTRGLKIAIVYQAEAGKAPALEQLGKLRNAILLDSPNLHAKCYFNEKEALITSLNLYKYSAQYNFELGAAFAAGTPEYQAICQLVVDHIRVVRQKGSTPMRSTELPGGGLLASLYGQRPAEAVATPAARSGRSMRSAASGGHCIRCATTIALKLDRPLCPGCYAEWARYKNSAYVEKFCHRCGKSHASSFEKPMCPSCYRAHTR